MAADLRHADVWVFDLDNTLYPAEKHLFRQIDARMTEFVRRELGVEEDTARRLQKDYYVKYGTTLSGLMLEHGVSPDAFLAHVHDIDLSVLDHDEDLRLALAALPGRRYIHTNGSVRHAENVIGKLGLSGLFDDIFDIRAAEFTPKPHVEGYRRFIDRAAFDPRAAVMFEDLAHNLEAAHALGMTTVLVCSAAEWFADEPAGKRPARPGDAHAHVHHVTDDLTAFLKSARTQEKGEAA